MLTSKSFHPPAAGGSSAIAFKACALSIWPIDPAFPSVACHMVVAPDYAFG